MREQKRRKTPHATVANCVSVRERRRTHGAPTTSSVVRSIQISQETARTCEERARTLRKDAKERKGGGRKGRERKESEVPPRRLAALAGGGLGLVGFGRGVVE